MPWTCLSRRERHRYLGLSIVIFTFVICSILVYASLQYTGFDYRGRSLISERIVDEECIPTCFTKECVIHANLLNHNMEPSVDQCEDFYSFSCAKFEAQYGEEDNISNYYVFNKRLYMEIKDLLDKLEADPESASGKMKIVYDSCIDTRSSELDAVTYAMNFFKSLGVPKWPNLPPDFEFTEPKLSKVLGTLVAYGVDAFIVIRNHVVNGQPVYDASVASNMFRGDRGLDIPNKEDRILKYFNLNLKELVPYMFTFFGPLARLSSRYRICEEENGTDFHLDCSQDLPEQWRMLCEVVETFVDVANVSHMVSKTNIFVPCAEVGIVEKILNLTIEVRHSVLVDLIMLNFFMDHLDDLNFYFRLIKQADRTPEKSPDVEGKKLNHWEHCVQWLTKHMVLALGHEYIKNIITEEVFIEAQDVIKECSQETMKLITNQKWLSDEEKKHILTELGKPVSTELQLKYYLNETYVNNYYSQFHPTPGSFLRNVLERQRTLFSTDEELKRDFIELQELTPFTVNAFNRQTAVEVGFGFLRFPSFVHGESRFLNMVRIAVSYGHELGHVIDDALEVLEKTESPAIENFTKRTSCFINQYSNFTIKSLGENVNAYMTEDENLSDAVSVILIDKLIKKYEKDEVTYSLPSLPYSTKELVYLIYTELMCEKTSKEKDQLKYDIDSHPQERFRITAVMQNSKYFSETFNCTEGSYMNPKTKCVLLDLE